MAGTLRPMTTAAERLALYLEAEAKILRGQEVRMGDRSLKMADLVEVRKAITELRREVAGGGAAAGDTIGGLRFKLANLSGR